MGKLSPRDTNNVPGSGRQGQSTGLNREPWPLGLPQGDRAVYPPSCVCALGGATPEPVGVPAHGTCSPDKHGVWHLSVGKGAPSPESGVTAEAPLPHSHLSVSGVSSAWASDVSLWDGHVTVCPAGQLSAMTWLGAWGLPERHCPSPTRATCKARDQHKCHLARPVVISSMTHLRAWGPQTGQ